MTIVHCQGSRLFCWLPPEELESALRVYERVAHEQPVDNSTLRRTNLYVAKLIRAELKKWKRRTPIKDVDIDFDNELTIDVPWTMKIVHQLEKAYNRTDMVIALDAFWSHYHESFTEAARMHKNPEIKAILIELERLANQGAYDELQS